MADTTNFGWTKPTPGGSSGAWGGILNTLFDAIDAALYLNAGKYTVQPIVLANSGHGTGWTVGGGIVSVVAGGGENTFCIPLPHLKPGQRITALSVYGGSGTGAAGTARLKSMDDEGTTANESTTVALPSSIGLATLDGLSVDVVADKAYYVECTSGTSGQLTALYYVQLTVEATP